MRPERTLILALLAGLAGLADVQPASAQTIDPPFGFYWAAGQSETEKVIQRNGARIVGKAIVQGRETWTIKGLIEPALERTILYFGTKKVLVEVELEYQHPNWDLVAYKQFLNGILRRLQSKYGPPIVLGKDTKKTQGGTMEIVGYEWPNASGSIQLFFFSAERNGNVYRSVSLHYLAG
jgi:hypothetical protein